MMKVVSIPTETVLDSETQYQLNVRNLPKLRDDQDYHDEIRKTWLDRYYTIQEMNIS
jgi:hypothetical protein